MVVACEQIRSSNSGNVCGEVGSEKYSSRCQLKDLPHFFETNCKLHPATFPCSRPLTPPCPLLSSCSLVHLRQSCRGRRQPPIGGASSPQLVTSHVSLILLLTKDIIAPLTSLTRYLVLHLLLVRQGGRKMVGRFGNKALGWGWAAMTVPQHNLFYLTPANASEHTAGHGGAQRTHSSPSFYT